MPTLQVFDPPMCCSTGVCGPSVNPALAQLAADLEWLKNLGVQVERYGLAQQPAAFRDNAAVREAWHRKASSASLYSALDDVTVSKGVYPTRSTTSRVGRTDSATGSPDEFPPVLLRADERQVLNGLYHKMLG